MKKVLAHIDDISHGQHSPLYDPTNALYGRFLKKLCITKRATNVPKRAFLASNVSSIIIN